MLNSPRFLDDVCEEKDAGIEVREVDGFKIVGVREEGVLRRTDSSDGLRDTSRLSREGDGSGRGFDAGIGCMDWKVLICTSGAVVPCWSGGGFEGEAALDRIAILPWFPEVFLGLTEDDTP